MPAKKPGPWRNGIRQEADKSWTAKHGQVWLRGHRSRSDALQAKAVAARSSGKNRGRRTPESVREFAARWMVDFPRQAESTRRWHAERVSLFVKKHGDLKLVEVTPAIAERFASRHPDRLASLKQMFKDAVKDRQIDVNPFQGIQGPKREGRRRIIPLTRQEVEALVETAETVLGDYGRDVYAPMLLTAAWTGVRPAELFALEWRDLDWDEGTLHVRRQWRSRTSELVGYTKNYLDRVVPLAPELDAVRRVPRIEGQPFIFFTARDASRLTDAGNRYYWHRVRDKFTDSLDGKHWLRQRIADGGKRLELYEATRHFFASQLSLQGVDTRDIAAMLGHQDDGELARMCYIHRREEDSRERVRKVLWAA